MIILYRAVSQQEKDDYDNQHVFRTGRNTLEAKQFFKSRKATKEYVANSKLRAYDPPYIYLFVIGVDEGSFNSIPPTNMKLDGYDAINIDEGHLREFNKCVKFVKQELL